MFKFSQFSSRITTLRAMFLFSSSRLWFSLTADVEQKSLKTKNGLHLKAVASILKRMWYLWPVGDSALSHLNGCFGYFCLEQSVFLWIVVTLGGRRGLAGPTSDDGCTNMQHHKWLICTNLRICYNSNVTVFSSLFLPIYEVCTNAKYFLNIFAKCLPSSFMPTSRHFWKRQYGHRFLCVLSMTQHRSATQLYTFLFCTVRLKKPLQDSQVKRP